MPKESKFVATAQAVAKTILSKRLSIERGAALLYQVTINNNLALTIDPARPSRGESAFQTDLCIFERKTRDIYIPRVVLEFKPGISTHDVLTYSAKARKHKQVYPYLRYGIVVEKEATVPRRFFTHNESLDFFVALRGTKGSALKKLLSQLIKAEVKTSRLLESIAYGRDHPKLFRSEIHLKLRN
jgi:hypothetical protein